MGLDNPRLMISSQAEENKTAIREGGGFGRPFLCHIPYRAATGNTGRHRGINKAGLNQAR